MQYGEQPHRVFPFRWIFPVGQLLFCMLFLSIVALPGGHVPYTVAKHVYEAIAAINLPGVLIQLPFAFLRADHDIWRPPGLSAQIWHSIIFPVSAMLFWWIAGRAAEALVAINHRQLVPKIGWVETVAGFLVMAGGATILGGMLFDLSLSGRNWQTTRLAAAGGLWTLLGALSVVARFRQWRFTKKQKAAI